MEGDVKRVGSNTNPARHNFQAVTFVIMRFEQVLERVGNYWDIARLEVRSRFPNALIFDDKHPQKQIFWIVHVRNNLGAYSTIYANYMTQGGYVFHPIDEDMLSQVRHFISEETSVLDMANLNQFLELSKMTYFNSDWVYTPPREI